MTKNRPTLLASVVSRTEMIVSPRTSRQAPPHTNTRGQNPETTRWKHTRRQTASKSHHISSQIEYVSANDDSQCFSVLSRSVASHSSSSSALTTNRESVSVLAWTDRCRDHTHSSWHGMRRTKEGERNYIRQRNCVMTKIDATVSVLPNCSVMACVISQSKMRYEERSVA